MEGTQMTSKEKREHIKLARRWAAMKATKAEIMRCMELDRRAIAASPLTNRIGDTK
jgi:hypothetical protein